MSHLTILLIRRDLKEAHKILEKDPESLAPRQLSLRDATAAVPAVLYIDPRPLHLPTWASFFKSLFDISKLPKVSSVPAALLVPVDDRIFAVVWSHGTSLLKSGVYDQTFGLRVALNSINPGRVRSYDKRRFDALFRQTREQAARETKLEAFGIDAERDLIRQVSGKPQDKTLGSSMTGGASLAVRSKTTPKELVHFLRRLYRKSQQEFTEEYPWLGRIEEVLDGEIKEMLDGFLNDQIRSNEANAWLSVPQIVEWSEISGFRFVLPNRCLTVFPDITVDYLIEALGGTQPVTVDLLHQKNVEMLDNDDKNVRCWKLYTCLNAEMYLGEEAYVLSFGSWYKIDADLFNEVNNSFASVPKVELGLPDYDLDDKGEFEYNTRAAKESLGTLCCLDRRLITFGGGKSKFELCDLLTESGDLICVKRYGGSSVLSHLFAQGLVSAELLMKSRQFRENADSLVQTLDFSMDGRKSFGGKHPRTVIFAIIGVKESLPLFALINLKNAVRGLRAFNWNAQLTYVPETERFKRSTHQRRRSR